MTRDLIICPMLYYSSGTDKNSSVYRNTLFKFRLNNLDAVGNSATVTAYSVAVNNNFGALLLIEEEQSPEEMFVAIKAAVKTTAEDILGKKSRSSKQP